MIEILWLSTTLCIIKPGSDIIQSVSLVIPTHTVEGIFAGGKRREDKARASTYLM
jgi:hypothetical protein